jgi:tRNA(Ile)-lysidine synthetase-like protein
MDPIIIKSILESPDDYNFGDEQLNEITPNEPLVECLINFLKINKIQKVILAQSGGVDSNVVFSILVWYKQNYDASFKLYTASVDYNNREESSHEINFVKEYNKTYGIPNVCSCVSGSRRHDGTIKRSVWEETTQKIRFDLFDSIKKEYGEMGVILGHHYDDETENIFGNVLNGRSPLTLSGVNVTSTKFNTIIYRPFMEFRKIHIFDFAHKYKIPYLKDTTPDWCKRGIQRRNIFPLIDKAYGDNWHLGLHRLSKNSKQFSEFWDQHVLKPVTDKVINLKYGSYVDVKGCQDYQFIFWESLLLKIFHTIFETSLPKISSIQKLTNYINKRESFGFELKRGFYITIYQDILIIFKTDIINKYNSSKFEICKNYVDDMNDDILHMLTNFFDGKLMYSTNLGFEKGIVNKNHVLRKRYKFGLNCNFARLLYLPTTLNDTEKITIRFNI